MRKRGGATQVVSTRRRGLLGATMEAGYNRCYVIPPQYTTPSSFGCVTLENLVNIFEVQFPHLDGLY